MARSLFISLLFLLALRADPSTAATITLHGSTFNDGHGVLPGDIVTSVGTFDPFDTTLGTLVSATFPIYQSGSASVTLSNLLAGDYSFLLKGSIALFAPDGSELLGGNEGFFVTGLVPMITVLGNGDVSPSGWGTGVPFEAEFSDGNSNIGTGRPFTVTSGLEFFQTPSVFTGMVNFYFTFYGPGFLPGGSVVPADTVYSNKFQVSPYGDITYEYIPVPEPSTALLMGIGLIGLGIRSRRGGGESVTRVAHPGPPTANRAGTGRPETLRSRSVPIR